MWGYNQALCRYKCNEAFVGFQSCAKRPLTRCESDLGDHTVIPIKHKDFVCVCELAQFRQLRGMLYASRKQ